MQKEVVITGRGLVTPLGIGLEVNEESLKKGKSGIEFIQKWADLGLASNVGGLVNQELDCPLLNKKNRRFMSPNAIYATVATHEALTEAGLSLEDIKNKRVAIIIGHGGSAHDIVDKCAMSVRQTGKTKRVSPFIVPQAMASSAVANLAIILGVSGESYTISSACASGAHAIITATRLLQADIYDIVITGGTEELNWIGATGFDAMRALSRGHNDEPTIACRPFDKDRDGFVIAEGAGMLILETAECAKSRDAKPIVKVSGFSTNTNFHDMVVPNTEASSQVILDSIKNAKLKVSDIDYVNTHGTSTPVGDYVELDAIKKVFFEENSDIAINSTKSMTGHMIGATGAIEIIFCTQMIDKQFICPTINLHNRQEGYEWANLVTETIYSKKVRHALSNSFGFGGTNTSIIVSAID